MPHNKTITYMKAIAIILMVLGHSTNSLWVYQVIYMFHMPLFFITSGYCFKEKYLQNPFGFFWKRVKGLWWPYVKWCLIFLAFHNVFFSLHFYNDQPNWHGNALYLYEWEDFKREIVNIFLHMKGAEPLISGLWFLNALFFGSLIAYAVIALCHLLLGKTICYNAKISILEIGICLSACLLVNFFHKTFTIFYVGPTALMAATFFSIGYALAKCKFPKFLWWQSLIAFGLMVFNSFYNLIFCVDPFYDTIKIVPYVITAVLGTWCIYSIPWDLLKGKFAKLLEYTGNHTLFILVWHLLSFKIVMLIRFFIDEPTLKSKAY